MTSYRALLVLALVIALAGCASVQKIETGSVTVGDRLTLQVNEPWNQFNRGFGENVPTWTREGFTVDALQFHLGLRDGGELGGAAPKGKQPLVFRSSMGPREVVALFEALWTRDGSTMEVDRIQPTEVFGGPGFRFEFQINRKGDDVRLRGVAFVTVAGGELNVMSYRAPRLVFFDRYAPQVQAMATTARLKSVR